MPRRTKGKFFVIEGTDGSGKTEQFKRLLKRVRRAGYPVATFDFPQYRKPSAYFVTEYLNGRYGGWKEVGPYKASLFYAMDRFDVGGKLRAAVAKGNIVVSNRYVSSNMGHQGAKIADPRERKKFFRWLYDLEYRILGLPKPDCILVLHVPARVAQKLVDRKGSREYVKGVKRDLHEADIGHLLQAERTYLEMVRMFPRDFKLVECVERGRLLSIPEVHERIWKVVRKYLRI